MLYEDERKASRESRLCADKSKINLKKRILFLGDSITNDGHYIAYLDAYFREHMPGKKLELINLGVSSETASGLSEEDHPFPRPCIHQRLKKALKEAKADWVIFCYGINDGIYYPFSEKRFKAYRKGMLKLVEKIKDNGAKAIALTPPPFDAKSIANKLLPIGHKEYSYLLPYEGYNQVLAKYSKWILNDLKGHADKVLDIFNPINNYVKNKRKKDPNYKSGDGIHPNLEGHWIIAKELLRELFNICLEQILDYVNNPEDSSFFKLVLERHRLLSSAWKEHVGHGNINKDEALPLTKALNLSLQIRRKNRKCTK